MTRAVREEPELAGTILGSIERQPLLSRMIEAVAGTAAFLASDDAGFVTGQVLSVSGGLTMVG